MTLLERLTHLRRAQGALDVLAAALEPAAIGLRCFSMKPSFPKTGLSSTSVCSLPSSVVVQEMERLPHETCQMRCAGYLVYCARLGNAGGNASKLFRDILTDCQIAMAISASDCRKASGPTKAKPFISLRQGSGMANASRSRCGEVHRMQSSVSDHALAADSRNEAVQCCLPASTRMGASKQPLVARSGRDTAS
jgi:hypothetical protein